jgi:hypothetical protein
MFRALCGSAAALLLSTLLVTPAHGQATRTWVSGVGDDVNPCSRTAPCKTFAGAISKTAAGGEISVLDPGGYGAVTITKGITISGDGSLASILNSGVNGVIVNVTSTPDTVILRNISINGAGTSPGLDGVRYLAAGRLIVENVTIYGESVAGIEVLLGSGGTGNLIVRDVTINGGAAGVKITSGNVKASMSNVAIHAAVTGVDALAGSVDLDRCLLEQNSGTGAYAEGGTINLVRCSLTGNGIAVNAAPGSILRMTDTAIFDNLTALGCGGGIIATAGDNRKGGNAGGPAACATTGMVTVF